MLRSSVAPHRRVFLDPETIITNVVSKQPNHLVGHIHPCMLPIVDLPWSICSLRAVSHGLPPSTMTNGGWRSTKPFLLLDQLTEVSAISLIYHIGFGERLCQMPGWNQV